MNADDIYEEHLRAVSEPQPAPPIADPGNQPSLTAYDPTARELARYKTIDVLVDTFEMDLHSARSLAEKLWGNETSQKDMGLGLADLIGVGEVLGIQEGVRQAERGINSDSPLDTAIGVGVAGLSAVGGGAVGISAGRAIKEGLQSPGVQEFLAKAVKEFRFTPKSGHL